MRTLRPLLAIASALSATVALADTVEATSTTYVSTGRQPRAGTTPGSTDVVTVAPVVEVLSVSAHDIRNPIFETLDVVVATWGSAELADRRWDAGTAGNLNGDVMVGYLRGQLWSRKLTLRVGREAVALGAGRVASIDGGDLALRLPIGPATVAVSAYAGAPVSQRFGSRDVLRSWNALGGDFAYGGRAALSLSLPLPFLRALEVGASAAFVDDGGEAVRRDAGVDARIRLFGDLTLNGWALWAIEAERLADLQALASWHPIHRLFVTADYRRSAPDLLLSPTSILSVFADATRDEAGGGLRFELTRALEAGLDYHALLEPDGKGGTELGHDVAVRGDYALGPIRAGAELSWLKAIENGYTGVRFFARREIGAFFATGDLAAYLFEKKINDQEYSASFGATAGYRFAKGWTAALSARAAVTPLMERQVDVMAKLAYNQTYRVREVK